MTVKQKITFVYLLPCLLLLTTGTAFYLFAEFLGKKQGYFCGFLFYRRFRCFSIPVLINGKNLVLQLFKPNTPFFGKHAARNITFLLLPVCFVYMYEFPMALKEANTLIIIISFVLSAVNAAAEEIL